MRVLAFCLLTGLLVIPDAPAAEIPAPPAKVRQQLPGLEASGSGVFRFLWMDIYTASLWTAGPPAATARPLALSLRYARDLDGQAIAQRSRDEMHALGLADESQLAEWLRDMENIFPDVRAGDQLTGVRWADGSTSFYLGETLLDTVHDPLFGEAFFAIWLHEQTSAPALRQALLGKAADP